LRDAGMLTMIDGPELISNSRRHDRNSGRRPVESIYLSGCIWSYDVRTGLEASEHDDVGQFP